MICELMLLTSLVLKPHLVNASTAPEELSFGALLQFATSHSLETQRASVARELAALDQRVLSHENDPHMVLRGTWSDHLPRNNTPPLGASSGAFRDQVYEAQLTANLYDFGRHSTHMDQASYAEQVSKLTQAEIIEALRFQIARAFAGVLAAERSLKVTAEQVQLEVAKLSQVRADYERGLRPESDVVSAELTLGRAKLAESLASSNTKNARLKLAVTISDDHQYFSNAPISAHLLAIPQSETLEQILSKWREFYPSASEIRSEMQLKALIAEEELISANQRPQLQGGLGVVQSGAWGSYQQPYYNAFVGLSWDVPWNELARDERLRIGQKRLDLEIQTKEVLKTKSDLDHLAREQFVTAKIQARQLKDQLQRAMRLQDLVYKRYITGKASALEVSAAAGEVLGQKLALLDQLNIMLLSVIDVAEARAERDIARIFE